MNNQRLAQSSGIKGVYLIDILASGVGIIILLLGLSISQRIILTQKKRNEKVEQITQQLKSYVKEGQLPVHADLIPEDYDKCYFESVEANNRRKHSFPVFKLHESIIEIDETGQIAPIQDVFSEKDEINTLNEYLKSITAVRENDYRYFFNMSFFPRISLHLYSPSLYYHFKEKLDQFDLKPRCYHFFPKIELPPEYRNDYVIQYEVTGKTPKESLEDIPLILNNLALKKRIAQIKKQIEMIKKKQDSLFRALSADSTQTDSSTNKLDSLNQLNSSLPQVLDSSLIENSIRDSLINTAYSSRSDSGTLDISQISPPPYPIDSSFNLEFEDGIKVTLLLTIDTSYYANQNNQDSITKEKQGSSIPNKSNSKKSPKSKEELDNRDIPYKNSEDKSPDAGRSFKALEEKQNLFRISHEENIELFKKIMQSNPRIRKEKDNSFTDGDQKTGFYNKLHKLLSTTSMPNFGGVEKDSFPFLTVKKEFSERMYIKFPLDTAITGIKLGINGDIENYQIDSVLSAFFRLRFKKFPTGGSASFIFHGDYLVVNEDTTIDINSFNWLKVGHAAGSRNPQNMNKDLRTQFGFVFGKVQDDSLLIDISINSAELTPILFRLGTEEEGEQFSWLYLVLGINFISVLCLIFIMSKKNESKL